MIETSSLQQKMLSIFFVPNLKMSEMLCEKMGPLGGKRYILIFYFQVLKLQALKDKIFLNFINFKYYFTEQQTFHNNKNEVGIL